MKKTLPMLLCAALLLGLASCAQKPGGAPEPATAPPAETNALLTDMQFDLADASAVEVKAYHLGEGVLKTSAEDNLTPGGKPVPCPLDGILAVPKGSGPFPLVMIVHGVHPNSDPYKDKNYLGFEFLVKQLAAQGFVAVAYNHNAEYHEEDYGQAAPGDG